MSDDTILARLLAGERIFVQGGHNRGGTEPGDIGGWYSKVRRRGRWLHSKRVPDGVEIWADDDPSSRRRGRRRQREYVSVEAR